MDPQRELEPLRPTNALTPAPRGPDSRDEPAAARIRSITMGRKVLALLIAAVSDAASLATEFAPPLQWIVDGLTAVALFAVLGFRWPLLPVLVVEAVPGLAAFPTWVLAVGVMVGISPTK